MSIRQFSANWNPVEDRILLRFNTPKNEEYRLWLTRSVVKSLFEQAFEFIQKILSQKHDARVAALIQDFQKQKINNHMSAGQAFQGGGLLPLGEAAILIAHLNLSASDQIMTKLTLQLVTQQKISIPLNFHALQSLVYLIEKLQIQAGWALHLGEMRIFQNAELTQDDQEPNKNNLH